VPYSRYPVNMRLVGPSVERVAVVIPPPPPVTGSLGPLPRPCTLEMLPIFQFMFYVST
jgi:hypothetical protein